MGTFLLRPWHLLAAVLPLLAGAGCSVSSVQDDPPDETTVSSLDVDTRPRGTLQGRVTWRGDLPEVLPFHVRANPLAPQTLARRQQRSNPNAPRIDPTTRGLGNALVFLRGKGAADEPWPHAPVRVKLGDDHFEVCQGDQRGQIGLVRAGTAVEFISVEKGFHAVRARGAAFFSLALPDPDRPIRRTLSARGIVELSSGAGRYWLRAYLLSAENPHCMLTDREGHFLLHGVPAGEHELVCWLPSWRTSRHERDPESGIVSRLTFQPPWELVRRVRVTEGDSLTVDFALSASPDNIDAR